MNRRSNLAEMARSPVDLLVIGGGITGAGVALDAASRGLRTALVERNDFASGTSSKSSKLIHGGLRYLAQFQFKVTIEASREKALLMRLAPHLVEDLAFVFPLYRGFFHRMMIGTGLWMYDAAAGFPKGRMHRHLGGSEARNRFPALDASRLRGAYLYHDAKADDCRLVLHVLKKAADLGALPANYAEVVKLSAGSATLRDRVTRESFEVRAKRIINATGVWCDGVRRLDDAAAPALIRPSKGAHIVLDAKRIGLGCAAILPSPRDGRVVFVIPWGPRVIVGTTDTDYSGDPDRAAAEDADIDYLLALLGEHLPAAKIGRGDVIGSYAGLRPLIVGGPDHPSKASRDHRIETSASGMITITGGKLTTYRRMAKEAVDLVSDKPCRTDSIDLFAAPATEDPLVQAYGSEAARIGDRSPIAAGLPYVWGEVDFAVEREMAVTLADVLERRTRLSIFDADRGRGVAEALAKRMASRLGWSEVESRRQLESYRAGR